MARTPDATDAHVGARLARCRRAMGLTQAALGHRLGLSAQQIQKYEAGTNRISVSTLSRIAALMDEPPGAFFPTSEPRTASSPGEPDTLMSARLLTASVEGRSVADHFPLIADRTLRQSVARVVEALASRG